MSAMDTEYRLLSIERIVDDIVLCEDDNRQTLKLPRKLLPKVAREGDCLRLYNDKRVEVDLEQTEQRKQRIRLLQNRLFREE